MRFFDKARSFKLFVGFSDVKPFNISATTPRPGPTGTMQTSKVDERARRDRSVPNPIPEGPQ